MVKILRGGFRFDLADIATESVSIGSRRGKCAAYPLRTLGHPTYLPPPPSQKVPANPPFVSSDTFPISTKSCASLLSSFGPSAAVMTSFIAFTPTQTHYRPVLKYTLSDT